MKQINLLGTETQLEKLSKLGDPLVKINKLIEWEIFREPRRTDIRKDMSRGRHILEITCKNTEQSLSRVHISGGGSQSSFWNQIKADVIGVPIVELENYESAIVGAAMFSACDPLVLGSLVKL